MQGNRNKDEKIYVSKQYIQLFRCEYFEYIDELLRWEMERTISNEKIATTCIAMSAVLYIKMSTTDIL